MRARVFVWVAMLGLAGSTPAFAQVAPAASRVWFDINFGAATSAAPAATFRFETEVFEEPLILEARYPKPSRTSGFDVGGGLLLTPMFGVGVSLAVAAFEDPAELFIQVPHPARFNQDGSDTAESAPLERHERAVHVHASFLMRPQERLSIRIFGGPTFFRYAADMVRDIEAEQVATLNPDTNDVTITGETVVRAEASAAGFHAGADVSYFFTRNVGAGAVFRFSRGTVTLDEEPMSEVEQDIKVGGVSFGAGVRVRF